MQLPFTEPAYTFLQGGGEIGALTRAYNWSQTPLGPPDGWPLSLRTTVGIVLHSAFPMFLFWGDELTCFYNDAYRPSLGNNGKHPALGKAAKEVWPEIWDFIGPIIKQVTDTGEPVFFEDQLLPIHRNGRLENVYWTFSYSPAYGDDGQISGVFVTCTETTEKVLNAKLQQQIDLNQQQLLASFEQAPVGIVIIAEEKLTFRFANQFYAQLTGRTPGELTGKPMFEALPELRGQGFDDLLRGVFATGNALTAKEVAVNIVRHNSSETIYVDFTYQPQYGVNNRVSNILVVCVDVTEQVLARKAVEESEARLRSLIDNAPTAIALFVGRDLVIDLPNQSFIDVVGKGSAIVGKPLREVMPELEDQPFLQLLDNVFTTGQTFQSFGSEVRVMQAGQLVSVYYNLTYTPLFNEAGDVYAILNIGIDVHEQIHAQQEVEQSQADLLEINQRLSLALDAGNLGSFQLERETGLMLCTPQCKTNHGQKPDTTPSSYSGLIEMIIPDDRAGVEQAMAYAFDTQTIYEVEYRVFGLDGHLQWIKASGQPVYSPNGQPTRMVGITQNITAQRMAREELERQVQERTRQLQTTIQDLERSNNNLQQFAYVASHDLQEPLRKIQSFGDMLRNQYSEQLGEMGTDFLDRMQNSANRMSILIKDLLTYSRISTRQDASTEVSLQTVMNTVMTDLDLAIQESGATLHVDVLPTVKGDSSQLGQLFQNLLSNAIKFRKPGESPHISITGQTIAAINLPPTIKPTRMAAAYYRIDVADNGIGFDEQFVERIFQVFQRLHGKGQFAGTGIGLAICEKVTANHGGAITASSEQGEGAIFSVYLPI